MKSKLIAAALVLLFFAVQNGFTQTSPFPPSGRDTVPPSGSAPPQRGRTPSRAPSSPSRSPSAPAEAAPSAPAEASPAAPSRRAPSAPAQRTPSAPSGGASAAAGAAAQPESGLYISLMLGPSMNDYEPEEGFGPNATIEGQSNFAFGVFAGSGGAGLGYELGVIMTGNSGETSSTSYGPFYEFDGSIVMLPFLFKYEFSLGPVVLTPLAGVYFSFATGDLEYNGTDTEWEPPLFGLMFGGSVGYNLWGGRIFADMRYASGFGNIVIDPDGSNPREMSHSTFMISLGYQYFL